MVQWTLVGVATGALLALLGVILGWGIFPAAVHNQIIKNVELEEGSDQFKRWERLPQALDFKVYIFNVTNPLEIQQGMKPKVVEIGPFVYSQYRQKNNIKFSRNRSKVSYTNQLTFHFNQKASAPLSQDDNITVLSMHMNTILQTAEDESYQNLGFINGEINRVFGKPDTMFTTTTPRKLLFEGIEFCVGAFGISKAICDAVEKKGTKTIRKMPDGSLRFSFFYHKNTTNDGVYSINTGLKDFSSTHLIEAWEGRDYVNVWKNDSSGEVTTCNMINGTDATGYPPFRERSDSMSIFSSDICRSVEIYYEKDISYQGIPGMRYITKDDFLNEIGPEYSSDCFCVNKLRKSIVRENGCLYRGALDLSTCVDAPVVLTLPHMMGAAYEYTSLIDGFKPDPEKHRIFIDIEPNTGTPMQGGKRVQFNMFLRKVDSIRLTDNLKTTLFPVLWLEEGIALNDEMVQLLNSSLINILIALSIVHWCLIVFGVILMLTMLGIYLHRRKKCKTVVVPGNIARVNIEQVREIGAPQMYSVKG